MKTRKPAVAATAMVAVVIAVLVVAGAGYYLLGRVGGGQPTQSGSSSSSSSISSSTIPSSSSTSSSSIGSSSSSSTPSSTSTSSSSSTTLTSSSNSSSSLNGRVVIIFDASNLLASSDVVANYTVKIDALGNVPSTLNMTATAPPGIDVTMSPSQFAVGGPSPSLVASIRVDPSAKPGLYGVNVTAVGGGQTYSSTVSLRVVTFLVVTVGTQFLPSNMTVPVGSTVYWIRLNGVISQYDNGAHNVVFLNTKVNSPTLQQYDTYSYQFTAAGDYPYYCSFHALMKADITVTP